MHDSWTADCERVLVHKLVKQRVKNYDGDPVKIDVLTLARVVLNGDEAANLLSAGRRAPYRMHGRGGDDTIIGGSRRDLLHGGPGDDKIFADDRRRDAIRCGDGLDSVRVNANDSVAPDCELVTERG